VQESLDTLNGILWGTYDLVGDILEESKTRRYFSASLHETHYLVIDMTECFHRFFQRATNLQILPSESSAPNLQCIPLTVAERLRAHKVEPEPLESPLGTGFYNAGTLDKNNEPHESNKGAKPAIPPKKKELSLARFDNNGKLVIPKSTDKKNELSLARPDNDGKLVKPTNKEPANTSETVGSEPVPSFNRPPSSTKTIIPTWTAEQIGTALANSLMLRTQRKQNSSGKEVEDVGTEDNEKAVQEVSLFIESLQGNTSWSEAHSQKLLQRQIGDVVTEWIKLTMKR
jgi:hypothetical protein